MVMIGTCTLTIRGNKGDGIRSQTASASVRVTLQMPRQSQSKRSGAGGQTACRPQERRPSLGLWELSFLVHNGDSTPESHCRGSNHSMCRKVFYEVQNTQELLFCKHLKDACGRGMKSFCKRTLCREDCQTPWGTRMEPADWASGGE